MVQALKNKLKNEKGFTLIELLAVIVILGILAAIAVPSILGLIDNSKKDAHVANAQQMISATKMLIASDQTYQTGTIYVTLYGLEHLNYLDTVDSPDGTGTDAYSKGDTDTITTLSNTVSYVRISTGKVTGVRLVTGTRGIAEYSASAIAAKDITRTDVKALAALTAAE